MNSALTINVENLSANNSDVDQTELVEDEAIQAELAEDDADADVW